MLDNALLVRPDGEAIDHGHASRSRDWDEVQDFCRKVYMPYRVRPIEQFSLPDATLISSRVGRVMLTRFSYGVPIHLDEFDPGAGNVLVLNTLRGSLRHKQGETTDTETAAGDSFVVDCSRTDYWLDGDRDHMQLNLTIPHDVLAETAERWFGFVPDDALWTRRIRFGGASSRWMVLLDYVTRTLTADLPLPPQGAIGRHLEEMICLDLLREWSAGAGFRLDHGGRAAAPYYVRQAEAILEAEARKGPTIADVASRVGVSGRTLNEGFRRFRGRSPRDFLAARRLDGFREDLLISPPDINIAQIAAAWGYVSFGPLAVRYRARFGEKPSDTRKRSLH
ncbi:AraC family transcriptional regulator [Zhengella mangrovi]|uniref:AraC family transcriptional regulator n=1 Tax=Zhengella mangrovi TaxID=1982044 RepID=A0A2G1QMX7_9HYPH|nr:helix-turn-helix transcriptional regulator [Zhengella mangrovi]PHP66800.1 AraC family transcriptional regulator [Zhengella mangrovi]